MSILFDCKELSKAWGSSPIFTDVTFSGFKSDRIGIIGPNGAGKSTLLKIIAGEVSPDSGLITRRKNLSVSYVPQMPSFPADLSIEQLLEQKSAQLSVHDTAKVKIQAQSMLMQAGLNDFSPAVGTLSGGWQKRLAIALGFAAQPELLLLDEPTNHLDLGGILWLEKLLLKHPEAWIMVSHDRALLSNTAKRIIEINRAFPGNSLQSNGNYQDHLVHRDQELLALQSQQESLQNKLRREKEWLQQGVKARTTKAKYRIDQAHELAEEVSQRAFKARESSVDFSFSSTEGKTKNLLKLENISLQLGEQKIFDNFSFTFQNKQIIGILGSNGSGKSSLLNLMAGRIKPQQGTISSPPNVRIVYFIQDRSSLDPELTLKQTIAPDSDSVKYQERIIHYASWLRRFGFSADHHNTKIGKLSGGEQARVLIALLMLQPADILLLDEPTNDLDIQTLDALEQSLKEFSGAVVIVSHDRYLMERLCESYLGFVDNGIGRRRCINFASIQQWHTFEAEKEASKNSTAKISPSPVSDPALSKQGKKLSYLEQREYDQIEETIGKVEQELEEAQQKVARAAEQGDSDALQKYSMLTHTLQEKIDELYERWQTLEAKKTSFTSG